LISQDDPALCCQPFLFFAIIAVYLYAQQTW